MTIVIEEATHEDLPGLARIVETTGLFPSEMLAEMIAPALNGDEEAIWLTCKLGGQPVGLCFAEPEEMAEGVWNMRALAVDTAHQNKGFGGRLVAALEARLQDRNARLLIVDTSGVEAFAAARRFYAAQGYAEGARLADFWAEGDDKVTFTKRLRARP